MFEADQTLWEHSQAKWQHLPPATRWQHLPPRAFPPALDSYPQWSYGRRKQTYLLICVPCAALRKGWQSQCPPSKIIPMFIRVHQTYRNNTHIYICINIYVYIYVYIYISLYIIDLLGTNMFCAWLVPPRNDHADREIQAIHGPRPPRRAASGTPESPWQSWSKMSIRRCGELMRKFMGNSMGNWRCESKNV